MKPLALIALILLALPQGFFAQDPPAPKPSGPIAELNLIVTGKDGKPITRIAKDEIRIFEDNVEQSVLSVEADDRPIDYGLVMDSSASLRFLMAAAVEAAKMIIANRRGSDEIFIEAFVASDNIVKLHDFSTDTNALLESLKKIRVEGGQSAVIDAIYLAAGHVAEHNKTVPNRRKALVIITDGEDRISHYKLNNLTKLLLEKGIQVFAIGLVIDLNKESGFVVKSPREKAEKLLNTITEETGGRVFYPKTGPELINASAEIIDHLRAQFRVSYQSSKNLTKGFRKVEVKLISQSGEKRKAITRRGYYSGDQAKPKEQKSQ
jgi:Ca-activated chloride channel family protein